MRCIDFKKPFLLFAALLLSNSVGAQDTLDQVLDRLKVQQTEHYRYEEVRHIELLEDPFISSGELFITKQRMLIVQQVPDNIVTDIAEFQLRYINFSNDVRRDLPLKRSFEVPGMEAFLSLLYGSQTRAELHDQYRFEFEQQTRRWILTMSPKGKSRIKRTRLFGAEGESPDRLKIMFRGEDSIEWTLLLIAQGVDAQSSFQKAIVLVDNK